VRVLFVRHKVLPGHLRWCRQFEWGPFKLPIRFSKLGLEYRILPCYHYNDHHNHHNNYNCMLHIQW